MATNSPDDVLDQAVEREYLKLYLIFGLGMWLLLGGRPILPEIADPFRYGGAFMNVFAAMGLFLVLVSVVGIALKVKSS